MNLSGNLTFSRAGHLTENNLGCLGYNHELGSNEVYAAMQQFGGITSAKSMMPGNEIPARPFLGIAPYEREKVVDIVAGHLRRFYK